MASCGNVDTTLVRVLRLLEAYVRGERTDGEIEASAREDALLAAIASQCLRCNGIAQEMLEALGRSPFDDDLPFENEPTPTRAGALRWLERVQDGTELPSSMSDWAADAFAWSGPERRMDPVVEEILSELIGSDDDVTHWTSDERRLAILRWHLERTDAALVDYVALAVSLGREIDSVRSTMCACVHGEIDEDELRATLERMLTDHRVTFPDLIDDTVRSVALLCELDAGVARVDALLEGILREADPSSALNPDEP